MLVTTYNIPIRIYFLKKKKNIHLISPSVVKKKSINQKNTNKILLNFFEMKNL